jgi:hypothetical protein
MRVVGRLAETGKGADTVVGHYKFELSLCRPVAHNTVMRPLAVPVNVFLDLAHRANQTLCVLFVQSRRFRGHLR